MNQSILKTLASQGLSTYKIAQQMNCGQTNVRYWLKKFNLTTKSLDCKTCGKILEGKRILFCSTKCKRFFHCREPISKQNNYAKQNQRGRERKLNLIKMKGGCCELCGYSKNSAALQFHHEDPTKKKHGLDIRNLSNSSWESCVSEVEKCKLLCANCHLETHNPTFFL
jgi:hypothetical protein